MTQKDPLEELLHTYIDDYVQKNQAARVLARGLQVVGVGFMPIVDHLTFRSLSVEKRAEEFLNFGYAYDEKLGVIEHEQWWAKVYRKEGYPDIFIDQAFDGERGKGSLIPEWVQTFGEKCLHHVAVRVENIEEAIFFLEKQGVPFAGNIVGDRGSDLRQIFSKAEMKDGKPFTVIELTERHHGYKGFLPPQADGLMESTRIKKT